MDKKKIIIVLLAILILILIIVFCTKNKNKSTEIQHQDTVIEADYKEVINNETGETIYQIYDKNTGEVIANTTQESAIPLYLDNPYFEESVIDVHEEEENANLITGSVWGND